MPNFLDPITINGDKVSKAETNAASTKSTPAAGDLWGFLDSVTPFLWVHMTTTQMLTWLSTLYDAAGAATAALATAVADIATHAALTSTHGVAGAIVGTTDVQSLSGKTIDSLVITSSERMTTGVTHENFTRIPVTIGDITSTQVLTIDLTTTSQTCPIHTEFNVELIRNGNSSVYGIINGWANWKMTGGGTVVLLGWDMSMDCSGTPIFGITALSNGIRISIASSAYTNTLQNNTAMIENSGFGSEGITVTVTIT